MLQTSMYDAVVKVIFLILLIIGVPYFVVTVSLNYKNKASGIVDMEHKVIEIQTETEKEIKILTQAEADTLNKINTMIEGVWVSEFDGRYKISIDANNKFDEFYDGVQEGFGVWRAFSGSQDLVKVSDQHTYIDTNSDFENTGVDSGQSSSTNNSVDVVNPNIYSAYTKSQFEHSGSQEPKYFFQKQQFEADNKGKIFIYQIQQLDENKFVLVFKTGTGKPLVFVRES